MGLNREMLIDLTDQSFHKLYESHKKKWDFIVETAVKCVSPWLTESDILRRADLSKAAEGAIRVESDFKAHCATHGIADLKQWAAWFAEYVVDQVYPEPDVRLARRQKG
jgi:hypothetical protein